MSFLMFLRLVFGIVLFKLILTRFTEDESGLVDYVMAFVIKITLCYLSYLFLLPVLNLLGGVL